MLSAPNPYAKTRSEISSRGSVVAIIKSYHYPYQGTNNHDERSSFVVRRAFQIVFWGFKFQSHWKTKEKEKKRDYYYDLRRHV